jgi:penicillin-binding protein 1C
VAWLVADVLSDNRARRRAFGADSPLHFDFQVACKTGTSTDFRDNWAVGYTPEFTVAVWVGNLDGAPMQHVAGVTGAAPVMHALVEHLHATRGSSEFARPPGIAEDWVDPLTGKRCDPARTGAVRERFLALAPPQNASEADYDFDDRVKLGVEYAEWFASGDNTLRHRAVLAAAPVTTQLRLRSPLPGARYFLDPDLPDSGQWLTLRAEGPATIQWSSSTLEIVGSNATPRARLIPGRHQITVEVPGTDQRAEALIEVKRR